MNDTSPQHTERWYNKDPKFSVIMETLETLDEDRLETAMIEVKHIIEKYEPDLIDEHIATFTLKRRWYDQNAHSWVTINSLQHASETTFTASKEYLRYYLDTIKK